MNKRQKPCIFKMTIQKWMTFKTTVKKMKDQQKTQG